MLLVVEIKCGKLQKKVTRLRKAGINISELVRKTIADYDKAVEKKL